MTEEKALTVRQANMEVWQLIQSIAPISLESRFFGVQNAEQAAMVMLKGYELGLGLAAAFEFIHPIDGKPSLSPKGALALIHQSGLLAGLKIEDTNDDTGDPWACRVTMLRTNGFEYTTMFTMNDARRAGIIKPKGGWEKYPANMLRWRAVGYCADVVFPDVEGGMLRPEELGAVVDENGEPIQVIDVEPVIVSPEIATTVVEAVIANAPAPVVVSELESEEPTLTARIMSLVERYGAAQILEVSGGSIPQTEEEFATVLGVLEVDSDGEVDESGSE